MTGRSKAVILLVIGGCAVAAAFALYRVNVLERAEESALDRLARVSSPPPRAPAAHRQERASLAADPAGGASGSAAGAGASEADRSRPLDLVDIEDIKQVIYEREIESVDRLHLLDDLVQTGDMDTRELWDREWSGVDDWKRDQNGFTLQRTEDGSLVFHPDQATMDLYTFYETLQAFEYDETTHEFVNEVDYYGKPIRNVLKFIKEDTLVMMTISGDKVDLNIYGDAAAEE